MSRRSKGTWLVLLIALVMLAPALLTLEMYRDWAFICENTASRKGHRTWFGIIETSHWYEESELDAFIKKNYPSELKYRWTSYAGDGGNIFGKVVSRGHGRPGAVYNLWPDFLVGMSDADKKQLYDVLVHDDQKLIQARIDQLFDDYLAKPGR